MANEAIEIKKNIPFPKDTDTFSEKNTPEWGMSVARAIESNSFYKGTSALCGFYTDRADFVERRAYAKGLQSTRKYLDLLATNGDLSYLNLDVKPLSIIPKLIDVVCNGMSNREYSIRAFSIDPVSQDKRIKYRQSVESDMRAKPVLVQAKETFGVDIGTMPIDQLPETDDELSLHMDLEYKQSIELSEELAIQTVFEENEYNEIVKKRVERDLAVLGVGWAKHRFCPQRGIVLEYVNPENKIHPYSDDPYFRNCHYHGEVKSVLTSDVLVEFPFIANDEKSLLKLENSSYNWGMYHNLDQYDQLRGKTELLYFTYLTTRERASKIKERKDGGKTISEAKESFNEDEVLSKGNALEFKRVSKVEQVLFEGVYVLGTDLLLKWEVSENMARPKSNSQKVIQQYIGISPNKEKTFIESLVSRMIPIEDKIQICELKAQQIIQKISPDGYKFDIDALVEMDLGDGKNMTAIDHLNMLMQTGSVFYRSVNSDGGYMNGANGVSEFKTGDSLGKLQALRNERDGYMNLIRDVIGLNKASDASSPDRDSLVGLQKLAAANSNTATRHIMDASNYITKKISEAICYRISDLIQYSDLKDDFIRKIGATAVMDLEAVKDIHLADFAIFLDLSLDDEERGKLELDLSREIEKGFLDTSDKYKILNIKNMKLATNYLAILKKKRDKRVQEAKAEEYKMQADQNIRAASESEKARQATEQMVGQLKGQLEQMVGQNAIAKVQAQGQVDQQNLQTEYALRKDLQYVINAGGIEKQNEAEDRKDQRTAKQATQQSELVDQRASGKAPIDFEAKDAGLDAFDFT